MSVRTIVKCGCGRRFVGHTVDRERARESMPADRMPALIDAQRAHVRTAAADAGWEYVPGDGWACPPCQRDALVSLALAMGWEPPTFGADVDAADRVGS